MKRLIFICICFLFCVSSWAEETSVMLSYRYEQDRSFDNRSITFTPTASHDGNLFYIHSYICIENLQITVKDVDGNIVYSDLAYLPAGNTLSLVLDVVPGEEYVIELAYGDTFLFGRFTP